MEDRAKKADDQVLADLAVRLLAEGRPSGDADDRLAPRLFEAWSWIARHSSTWAGWFALGALVLVAAGHAVGPSAFEGGWLGAPGGRLVPVILLALLGVATLLLREGRGLAPATHRLGVTIAAVSSAVSLLLLVSLAGSFLDLAWAQEGAWREPLPTRLLAVALLGAGLATIDRGAPKYRWTSVLVPLAGVALLLTLVDTGYDVGNLIEKDAGLDGSLLTTATLVGLYAGFVFLRCGRGLAHLLLEHGPGSAAVRLMIPAALVLVLVVGIVEHLTGDPGGSASDFGTGWSQAATLSVLVALTYPLSRQLQSYYHESESAAADLSDRAAILENLFEGVGVIGVHDRRFIFNNRRLEELLGYDEGELVGVSYRKLIPEDETKDEAEVREELRRRLFSEGSSVEETRCLRKDDSVVQGRSASILTDSRRYGPVIVWSFSDLTSEYSALQAKEKADLVFREVFDRSPVGLSMIRADHGFETVNPAFCRITGYSEEELLTMTFDEITHPDDLARDRELSGEMFGGNSTGFIMEKRYIRKDGEVVWVQLSTAPLREDGEGNDMALSIIEDITARRVMTDELSYMADHDVLTGVFNRRRLGHELERTLSDDDAAGRGVALLLLDLDNFKFINDRYGHSVGDQLIVIASEVLSGRLRADDVLARQGGDEFVIMLRGTSVENAMSVARELTEIIARDARIETAEVSAQITASVGIAYAPPGEYTSEDSLLRCADIAMYEAKEEGRNKIKLYDPTEDTNMERGVGWTGRIARAVETDGFVAFAQPILLLDSPEEMSYELFVRMKDEDGTLHPPGVFLPVAERHDLVQGIDRWMFCQAVELLAAHRDAGIRVRLSVNLSGKSLGDPKLLDLIASKVAANGIDPELIVFEITETSAIRNVAQARTFSTAISELGCSFALDDFGSGFASFSYLQAMDFKYVKIDGEFVRGMVEDDSSRFLVKAMIDMAQGLGQRAVAEMVEDRETFDLLRELGVDSVQGYLIGRPEPVGGIDFHQPVAWPPGAAPDQ